MKQTFSKSSESVLLSSGIYMYLKIWNSLTDEKFSTINNIENNLFVQQIRWLVSTGLRYISRATVLSLNVQLSSKHPCPLLGCVR